ncbi:MAG: hypothetical protein AUI36_08680 [Cyanobacteria bacterium 13_1_40CM_2_61_4]|nr:MAG: hypothetical protein AUI36_08680 [Cyanobacteria bacterium 13_1_40CM_2_61_4]
MFVEQMIAISDGRMDYEVPNNIPQLMLYYLNNINRFPAIKELDDRTVQHVSKIIAWECLKETYRPVAATRESILKSLVHEKQVEELLAYLEDRLRLINISGPEKNQIRFGLDPLAEYLAALYIVDSYGNARDFWQEFLIKADSVPEQSREFLFAVRDCCLARPMNEEVRCYAVTEIERRLRLAH